MGARRENRRRKQLLETSASAGDFEKTHTTPLPRGSERPHLVCLSDDVVCVDFEHSAEGARSSDTTPLFNDSERPRSGASDAVFVAGSSDRPFAIDYDLAERLGDAHALY